MSALSYGVGAGGWGSCCAGGWLKPFCFSVALIGMVHVVLGCGCVSVWGPLFRITLHLRFSKFFKCSLILMTDIRCGTGITFFFVYIYSCFFPMNCNYCIVSGFHGVNSDDMMSFHAMTGTVVVFFELSFN